MKLPLSKSCPRLRGKWHGEAMTKGDSSRARPVGDAARGESGGIGSIASGSVARRPYSNQRCGFRVSESRRGCSVAAVVYVNPSVKPSVCQLPVEGSLLVRLTTSLVHPPLGGFHIAKQYFTARQRNFTLRQQDFTALGSSPRHRRSCPCLTG